MVLLLCLVVASGCVQEADRGEEGGLTSSVEQNGAGVSSGRFHPRDRRRLGPFVWGTDRRVGRLLGPVLSSRRRARRSPRGPEAGAKLALRRAPLRVVVTVSVRLASAASTAIAAWAWRLTVATKVVDEMGWSAAASRRGGLRPGVWPCGAPTPALRGRGPPGRAHNRRYRHGDRSVQIHSNDVASRSQRGRNMNIAYTSPDNHPLAVR